VSASYQRVQIDTLEGMDIRDLSDTQAPIFSTHPRGPLFTIPHFAMNLGTNQVTVGFTYGVTDDLEINPAVPVLQSDLDLNVALQGTGATHFVVERSGKLLLPPTSVTDLRGESRGFAYELSGLRDQRLQHRELRSPVPAARRRGRYEQHLLCRVPLREHDDNGHDNLDRPIDEHKCRPEDYQHDYHCVDALYVRRSVHQRQSVWGKHVLRGLRPLQEPPMLHQHVRGHSGLHVQPTETRLLPLRGLQRMGAVTALPPIGIRRLRNSACCR
jgi:hypothetical protein